jgi:hypothetical protein
MKHYVYYSYEEWGRGYLGCRSCKCEPEEDASYFGSFTDPQFKPTQKIVLDSFETRKEALEAEILLHVFFDVVKNPHFANRAKQTSSGFYYEKITPEHRAAISKANRGRVVSYETRQKQSESHKRIGADPEVKRKRSESAKKKPPVTEETRKKLSEAQKKRTPEQNRRKGRPGRPQSEEHRKKRAEAQVGRTYTEETKRKISESLKRYNETKRQGKNQLSKKGRCGSP